MSLLKSPKHTCLAPVKSVPESDFLDLSKSVLLEGQNTKCVKYDVYLDRLLVGSIYVGNYIFLRENNKSPSSIQPHHPCLGTGMYFLKHTWTETPGSVLQEVD